MQVNVDNLLTLANKGSGEDDLKKYERLPDNIREALKAEMEESQRNATKQVAKQLVQILGLAEDAKQSKVEQIRSLRAQERQLKHELETLDKAQELAEKDANFIPLCLNLGLIAPHKVKSISIHHPKVLEYPEKNVDNKKKKK
jgi:hypothetical protein